LGWRWPNRWPGAASATRWKACSPDGDDTPTVNVLRVSLRADVMTGEFYLDDHGPALRALRDLGDRRESRCMYGTGQSGLFHTPL
jgi:hypothetical protein